MEILSSLFLVLFSPHPHTFYIQTVHPYTDSDGSDGRSCQFPRVLVPDLERMPGRLKGLAAVGPPLLSSPLQARWTALCSAALPGRAERPLLPRAQGAVPDRGWGEEGERVALRLQSSCGPGQPDSRSCGLRICVWLQGPWQSH